MEAISKVKMLRNHFQILTHFSLSSDKGFTYQDLLAFMAAQTEGQGRVKTTGFSFAIPGNISGKHGEAVAEKSNKQSP